MSELRINNITDTAGSSGPIIAGVSTVSSTSHMVMPSGPTEMRGGRGRMIMMGGFGYSPNNANQSQIQRLTISTLGNALDFGDMTTARYVAAQCASSTRGIAASGEATTIEYVTISSGGGGNDFGDTGKTNSSSVGLSDSTRGVFAGGYQIAGVNAKTNLIEFITIASTGDTTDFGSLTEASAHVGACASPSRGIIFGGHTPTVVNTIQFITISSTGDAQDFGDLTVGSRQGAGLSNTTRGLHAGGIPSTAGNVIAFITIASTGNAQDFGDLSQSRKSFASFSNNTTGFWAGGDPNGSIVNIIDKVAIASLGNATDFGDLTIDRETCSGCSNAHGGLQ